MKKLIIVESPSKIKTIKKFLGPDFIIMSTVGHIKDLPSKKIGVEFDKKGILIDYVILEGKEKVIADICKQASKSDEIFLAADPDREGEIICEHTRQEVEKVISKKTPIFRILFNEITKPAIIEAIENPTEINKNKVLAQQARRVVDRLVGYEVSPILWKKIKPGLSAGRVQSVALRLICEREKAIRAFTPEEYWTITAHYLAHNKKFTAELTNIGTKKVDIKNKEEVQKILKELKNKEHIIDAIVDKNRIKNPYPPFMTSTLQQAGFSQLGFPVKKTMTIAQKLYEGIPLEDETPTALITYMRTDSLRISDTVLKQARTYIKNNFSGKYIPSKSNVYAKKGKAQDAHEAIRPVDVSITPEYVAKFVPADTAKVYELIWKRFVASQMTPAEYAQRQVVIKADKFTFKATGSTLLFDGFLAVYKDTDETDSDENTHLPKELSKTSELTTEKLAEKQHFTQAPPRYNEGSLVKELEKEGIGRPSTYATILNTICARAYTTLDKKRFIPTELGMAVTDLLVANLPKIMDVKFTAHMEEDLDKIAHGELDRDFLLTSFNETFHADLDKFIESVGKKGKPAIETNIVCPQCKDHKLLIRFSKLGEFLGCKGYPECNFTSNFTRAENGDIVLQEAKPIEILEEKCPDCGKNLRKIETKNGSFVGCSGYPECKYVKVTKASFKCPLCKKGDVIQKAWKRGKFWGCSNYPECKFVVFADIKETPCPQCHWPFLTVKKTKKAITTACANKECGYATVEENAEE